MKVIYIDRNFIHDKYKNGPEDGDAFYTMGFAGIYSREFKKHNPDWDVECWKADYRANIQSVKLISGVQFRMFPAKEVKYLGTYSTAMKKALKQEIKHRSDLVVNISSLGHLLFYQMATICKRVPLFVQGHGENTAKMDLRIRKGVTRKIQALIHSFFERKSIKNINVYYALDARYHQEMPNSFSGDLIVQTTGVDAELFKPLNKQKAKQLLKLDISKKYILFVGRLDYTKRVDLLIDVWEELKDKYPDWQLLLVGNSRDMPLTNQATKVGAIIKGRVLQTEMSKYLSAANIYVLANLKGIHTHGGVGMLPVQALFCETPIVGVTVRNIPEEIRSDLGIYTDTKAELEQAIEDIITNKKRFSNLRELAVKEYSWEQISIKTKDKYLECLYL
jgi:glycosyltransferase involved in cell wall biosynthesis